MILAITHRFSLRVLRLPPRAGRLRARGRITSRASSTDVRGAAGAPTGGEQRAAAALRAACVAAERAAANHGRVHRDGDGSRASASAAARAASRAGNNANRAVAPRAYSWPDASGLHCELGIRGCQSFERRADGGCDTELKVRAV